MAQNYYPPWDLNGKYVQRRWIRIEDVDPIPCSEYDGSAHYDVVPPWNARLLLDREKKEKKTKKIVKVKFNSRGESICH